MLSERQTELLKKHNISVSGYNSIEELLEAIDDAVVENIVTHNDEPDSEGIELQRIYDGIRWGKLL